MREQLLNVYNERHQDFKDVKNKFPDEDMAGPFLMSPTPIYDQQANPLLIIGQETFGWEYSVIVAAAKKGLTITLFLIGAGLSFATIKVVGIKPLIQGVLLWLLISVLSITVILFTMQ